MKIFGNNNVEKIRDQIDVSFKILAELIPAGIYLTDSSGNCLYVNSAWCRMAGMTLEESIGTGWINAIHNEDRSRIYSEWDSFVHHEIPWESEYRFVDKSGKISWVHGTASLIIGSDGSVEGIIGININITDRKIYEIALKESEERLRLASEASGLGTFSYDFESGSAYYSKEFLDLCGLSSNETPKLDKDLIAEAIHPDDKQRFLKEMLKANDPCGSGILDFEFRIILPDGTEKWLRTRGLTKFSGNSISDKPLRAVGIVQDITDRKQTNEKLLESEKRYRSLVELTPIGIAIYQNGLFVFINTTGLKMMGCKDQKDIMGKPVLSFVHPESHNEVKRRMRLVAGGVAAAPLEEKLLRLDGTVFYAEVTSVPTIFDEKPAVQVLVKDISDRKKAEEKLKQSSIELRDLSRHIGELMETERTQIAHDLHDDLGQKLTALNMDIAWIKSRIGVQSRIVETKMHGMSKIMNESFESLRKIAYGLRPSILDNLGLYPAIEWQLMEFKNSTGINFSLSFIPKEKTIDSKLSLVVFRIVQESLTNVARHSKATKVIVKIKVDDKKLKLIVRDNGIGIDSEKLRKSQSFGLLGMKERARSYGGEVTVEGMPGEGTVLEMEIPVI